MPHPPRIEVVREGAVAILFLDNPPRNLLTRGMISAIATEVAGLEREDEVRSVIVTGAAEAEFSGGLDLAEWFSLSPKEAQEEIQRGFDAFWAVEHMTKPTIAAVSGVCRGAGAELALACDLRVATETAVFSHPDVDLGAVPFHGGTARLPRILGRARALELLLTGKELKALDALRLGLVNHLTPPGDALDRAKDIARVFASKPRAAIRAIKRTVTEGEEKPYRNRFLLESQHAVQILGSEDYRASVARSRQKKGG